MAKNVQKKESRLPMLNLNEEKNSPNPYGITPNWLVIAGLMWDWSEMSGEDLFTVFSGPKIGKKVLQDALDCDEDVATSVCGTGETTVYKEVATGVLFMDSGKTLNEKKYTEIFNKNNKI
jgi:hypothetical protein